MTDTSCVFCNIAAGQSPATIVYEDDLVIAFNDLYPTAPVHILIVPKVHLEKVSDMHEEHEMLFGHMTWAAKQIADEKGLEGYKLLFNVGKKGGQVVMHVHLHLMGGWQDAAGEGA